MKLLMFTVVLFLLCGEAIFAQTACTGEGIDIGIKLMKDRTDRVQLDIFSSASELQGLYQAFVGEETQRNFEAEFFRKSDRVAQSKLNFSARVKMKLSGKSKILNLILRGEQAWLEISGRRVLRVFQGKVQLAAMTENSFRSTGMTLSCRPN